MRRLTIFAFIALMGVTLLAVSAADDFNRSDAANLGANYTANIGAVGIASNRARIDASGSGASYHVSARTNEAFSDDQYTECTVPVLGDASNDYQGVAVRVHETGANTDFYIYFQHGSVQKIVDGAFTGELASGRGTWNANDVVKISATGGATTTIKVYINGSQQGANITDSSSAITTGSPGIGAYDPSVTANARWDDCTYADVVVGGGGGTTCLRSLLGVGCDLVDWIQGIDTPEPERKGDYGDQQTERQAKDELEHGAPPTVGAAERTVADRITQTR